MKLDDFLNESKRSTTCPIGKLVGSLDGEKRQVLETALVTPEVAHTALPRVLKSKWGIERVPDARAFGRHRRGECACPSA